MARLTITNMGNSGGAVFGAGALRGGGTLIDLGGNTKLTLYIDEDRVSVFTNRNTDAIIGLGITGDIPGLYRYNPTATAPATDDDAVVSDLFISNANVRGNMEVVYEDGINRHVFT